MTRSERKRVLGWLVLTLVMATGGATVSRTAPPAPLPCASEALAEIAALRELLGVLGLPPGPLNALEAKLDAAESSVAKGNANSTQGQLGALRNQVQALAAAGLIDPADLQALLDAVDGALGVAATCSATPRLAFFSVRSTSGENTLFWVNPATAYGSTFILVRTDGYPTGPNDPAAFVLGTFAGTAGQADSTTHAGLSDGTTYYYAAFAESPNGEASASRTSFGRPDDASLWAYTVGRPQPIVGLTPRGFPYHVLSEDALHILTPGATGGGWPPGLSPVRIPAPSRVRPGAVPWTVGPATGLAFVSSRTGRLYAVSSATGAILWTSPDLGGTMRATPSGSRDARQLFLGVEQPDGSGAFYSLGLDDGAVLWRFDAGGALGPVVTQASLDLGGRRAFFTSRARAGADTVWCLDFDGHLLWSARPGDVHTSPTVSSGSPVYVGTLAGEIHALDNLDGLPRWPTPWVTGDGPVRDLLFPGGAALYFSTVSQVHAIQDAGAAATPFWPAPLSVTDPSVPVPFGGRVYIPTGDGRLLEVDAIAPSPATTRRVPLGDPGRAAALGPITIDGVTAILTTGSREGVSYAVTVPLP